MLLILFLAPFFTIVTAIIGLLPSNTFNGTEINGIVDMFSVAFNFFPPDVWFFSISSIVFWLTVQLLLSFFTFVIKMFFGGVTL